jgi:protein required for attachment to host cells
MTSGKEAAIMARPLTLRIVVVDGEHARFVQPDEENALRTVGSFDSASAHRRSRDLGSDRPGRSFESGASARHALGQRHNLHAMEKAKFIRLVGQQIDAASVRDEFDELLLVAPTHVLHELHKAVDPSTQAKLVGTLDKDLVKTPDHELWRHVREWVSPVRRPVA